jgi:hypothetical protein
VKVVGEPVFARPDALLSQAVAHLDEPERRRLYVIELLKLFSHLSGFKTAIPKQ